MTIKVQHNQSLIDLSIQMFGGIEGAVDLAIANGLPITEELIPGMEIIVPEYKETKAEIVKYYGNKGLTPATAGTAMAEFLYGIGTARVESTFIIR